MPSLKLLTIMIPVYNGGKFIDSLLKQFENYISDLSKSDDFFDRVEIIVFNNVSTDHTREVVERYLGRIPNLSLVNHKDHVKTAEENVFRSYAYCKGTYTWTLGVDDFPVFDNFAKALHLLESNRYDFLIFNLGTVNQDHRLVKTNIFSLENQTLEGSLTDLSQLVGMWFVVAAMSNQILRTSLIRGYDLDALVKKTSAIYSHVVAYLEAFAGKTSTLVGFPLVFYKVTYRDTAHWNRTAESLGVYNEYFWTEGLVRQIEYLEEKGLVPKSFFFNLLDRNEYFVFRPVFVVVHKVISQLILMCEKKCAPRNVISSESLQRILRFIESRDPYLREIIWEVDGFYELMVKGNRSRAYDGLTRLRNRLDEHIKETFLLSPFLIEVHQDFEIYKIGNRYLAVHYEDRELLLERISTLNMSDFGPIFFQSKSKEALLEKVDSIRREAHGYFEEKNNLVYSKNLEKLIPGTSDLRKTRKENKILKDDLLKLERSLDNVFRSRSWRMTYPIRLTGDVTRKFVRMVR